MNPIPNRTGSALPGLGVAARPGRFPGRRSTTAPWASATWSRPWRFFCGGDPCPGDAHSAGRPRQSPAGAGCLQRRIHHARLDHALPVRRALCRRTRALHGAHADRFPGCGISAPDQLRLLDVSFRRPDDVFQHPVRACARCGLDRLHAFVRAALSGTGLDFWLLGLSMVEIAGIGAALEIIVTILKFRAPAWPFSMPLFVWAYLVRA
jgi:hypothetical protein